MVVGQRAQGVPSSLLATRTQPSFLTIQALTLAGRPFLGGPDVEVITPGYNVIAFDLEDAHHHRRTNLATVGALEPIQSFGKHAVPVGCNCKHVEIGILDPDRLFCGFDCRDRFTDAGPDRDTFIHPDRFRREPLSDGTLAVIFENAAQKAVTVSIGVGIATSFPFSRKRDVRATGSGADFSELLDQHSVPEERLMLTEVLPESLGIVSCHGGNNALSCRQRRPPR